MGDEPEVCTKISEKVKMAGFLEKKGSMLWKRYWFVLEDRLLLYYKSQIEYINLSPCRGSLNMGLVSCVQPRRNSRDPIIHLVTRSSTLFLRAKTRELQERWLQSLLESMGKMGTSTLRFSLDDLPGEIQAMTLPRRFHTGSLDAVWKPAPVIPKSKMMDKVLGYDEEPDENQNTDMSKERKSQTLDSRRMDSRLEKLRNALARRKSSTVLEPEMVVNKQRRESFLTKMFKKSPTKNIKETEVHDSDADDPLYDKIENVKNSESCAQKQLFGSKIILPEGTMTELKNKLRSKENLHEEEENLDLPLDSIPPELPPRGSLSTISDITTVAQVHNDGDMTPSLPDFEDSEESEASGHYQTIHRIKAQISVEERTENENTISSVINIDSDVKPSDEVQYQVVDKEKKKKRLQEKIMQSEAQKMLLDEIEKSILERGAMLPQRIVDTVNQAENESKTAGSETTREAQGEPNCPIPLEAHQEHVIQIIIEGGGDQCAETKEESNEESKISSTTNVNDEVEDQRMNKSEETRCNGENITKSVCTKETNVLEEQNINKENYKSMTDLSINEHVEEAMNNEENLIPISTEETNVADEKNVNKEKFVIDETLKELNLNNEPEKTRRNEESPTIIICNKETIVDVEHNVNKGMVVIDEGLTDLNSLLLRLVAITTAPLTDRQGEVSWSGGDNMEKHRTLQRCSSDPDYDVPRPHGPLLAAEEISEEEVECKKCDESDSENSISLEPDSLENKETDEKNFDVIDEQDCVE